MIRKLLLTSSLFIGIYANGQTLLSDNFNSLTIGNVGTDLTGVTAGQNSWYTYNSAGGTNAGNGNYQIVASDATHVKAVQITGSNAATGSKYLWKSGLSTAWPTRTSGNDIIEIEFDFNPGAASTSKNSFQVFLYNGDGTKILAGLRVAMDTKQVSGALYADNAGTLGNYGINLGATAPVLTASTWVTMGMSFNKTTGQVIWRGPGFNGSFTGAAIGEDPDEVDFIVAPGTSNTVAGVGTYDNFMVRASASDTLLGTNTVSVESSKLSVYPNPAKDYVNITNSGSTIVEKVTIVDVNGRVVKTVTSNSNDVRINISDLNTGVYFMNINTNEGPTTKKIIKN